MILEQLYLGCLSQASYFIADPASGKAAVVDPRRDIDDYLQLAEQHGVAIEHAILTHFHADFASGHLELAERCGARVYLGPGAAPEYDCHNLADGESIDLGGVRLQALSTPGHTPESICVLVFDKRVSDTEPHAVLTGDTLFIGDAGRPDLLGSQGLTAEAMAGQLFDSLRRLMALPPETTVYPGHGAGSMCGKNLSSETVSTIGEQLATNCALKEPDRDAFIASITANQPQVPDYFRYDVAFNKANHATLTATRTAALQALSVDAFLAQRAGGAVVLDTRHADAYAAGHLHASLNVGLGGNFATWAGTVIDVGKDIVLLTDPGGEEEAVTRLGRIGLDRVRGYLDGGPAALADHPEWVRTRRATPAEFADLLARKGDEFLLDVRNPGEFENGAIEGAALIPLRELAERIDEVPFDRPVAIYCGSGYRSATAKGLLEARGNKHLIDLIGGFGAWDG